jgi:hypothetical protein
MDPTDGAVKGSVLVDSHAALDKPWLARDPSTPSRLHLAWVRRHSDEAGPTAVTYSSSLDGGKTFTTPRVLARPRGRGEAEGLQIFAFDSTHLLIVYSVPVGEERAVITVLRSSNGGRSWSRPDELGGIGDYGVSFGGQPVRTADFFPAAAVASDGRAAIAVQSNYRGDGEIAIVGSRDFGRTWSDPSRGAGGQGQAFTPTLALGSKGRAGLAFYMLDRGVVTLWFASTRKSHGNVPDFRNFAAVGDGPLARVPGPQRFLGDYQGLTASADSLVGAFVLPGNHGPATRLRLGDMRR